MPILNFYCQSCGKRFEEITLNARAPRPPVPTCCGKATERYLEATSFTFKTKGGNNIGFSGAHGPYTFNKKKLSTIGHGHGLGGRRGRKPPTSPEKLQS
jgi:putative FmdB family regulatory protein